MIIFIEILLILLLIRLPSKGREGNKGHKHLKLYNYLIRLLTLKMWSVILEVSFESYNPNFVELDFIINSIIYWLKSYNPNFFELDFIINCIIYWLKYETFTYPPYVVEHLNMFILSQDTKQLKFNISKCLFHHRTQDKSQDWVLVLVW